jgi:hypothetical protein
VDVNRERVQLWVEALESGEFQQGRNQLRNSCGFDEAHTKVQYSYCCLGVAIEVALRNGYEPQEYTNTLGQTNPEDYDHLSTVLWPGIVTWYGLDNTDPLVGLALKEDYEDEREEFRLVLIADDDRDIDRDELSASQANDDHHATFDQIAAGLRVKYLGETLTEVPDAAE